MIRFYVWCHCINMNYTTLPISFVKLNCYEKRVNCGIIVEWSWMKENNVGSVELGLRLSYYLVTQYYCWQRSNSTEAIVKDIGELRVEQIAGSTDLFLFRFLATHDSLLRRHILVITLAVEIINYNCVFRFIKLTPWNQR